MNELNQALRKQIDRLSQLCCSLLKQEVVGIDEQAEPVIKALVVNGYARLSDVNLQTRIEAEVDRCCRECAMHRRDELTGIARHLQDKFTQHVRWETASPRRGIAPQAANISSNTDA